MSLSGMSLATRRRSFLCCRMRRWKASRVGAGQRRLRRDIAEVVWSSESESEPEPRGEEVGEVKEWGGAAFTRGIVGASPTRDLMRADAAACVSSEPTVI